jgi:hypothetical protein
VGNQTSAIRIEGHFSIGLHVSQTMLFQCLLSFYEQLLKNPVCGAKKPVVHNRGLLFRLLFIVKRLGVWSGKYRDMSRSLDMATPIVWCQTMGAFMNTRP